MNNIKKIIINNKKYKNYDLIKIGDFECLYYRDKFSKEDFITAFEKYIATNFPEDVSKFFKTIDGMIEHYGCENEIDLFEKYGEEINKWWIKIASDKDYYYYMDSEDGGGFSIISTTDDYIQEWCVAKNVDFIKQICENYKLECWLFFRGTEAIFKNISSNIYIAEFLDFKKPPKEYAPEALFDLFWSFMDEITETNSLHEEINDALNDISNIEASDDEFKTIMSFFKTQIQDYKPTMKEILNFIFKNKKSIRTLFQIYDVSNDTDKGPLDQLIYGALDYLMTDTKNTNTVTFTNDELVILKRCVDYTVVSQEAWLSEKDSITNKQFVAQMEEQYNATKKLSENIGNQITSK